MKAQVHVLEAAQVALLAQAVGGGQPNREAEELREAKKAQHQTRVTLDDLLSRFPGASKKESAQTYNTADFEHARRIVGFELSELPNYKEKADELNKLLKQFPDVTGKGFEDCA